MTQTPQQDRPQDPAQDPAQDGAEEQARQDRVNTANLRDYTTLRRSVTDRKVAGVAGGLGRHLNVDPTILRVAFVVLCFFGGAGFVVYGAAWLLVPEDGKDTAALTTNGRTRNVLLIGAAVVAGLLLVGDSWGGFWSPWPLALIALVLFVVLMNRNRPEPPQDAPAEWTGAGPAPLAYQSPAARPDRGPKLFWITAALVAVALGSLGVYDSSGGAVVSSAYPALALTVVGAMLLLGAWVGRPGGLIFLGVVAAVALAATSVAAPRFDGDRRIDTAPTSAAQVENSYFVPAGRIQLDLTDVADPEALAGRSIDLGANAGEIVVIVPDDMNVDVSADVSVAGEANVFGQQTNGPDVHLEHQGPAGSTAGLGLDIRMLVGSIEVRTER